MRAAISRFCSLLIDDLRMCQAGGCGVHPQPRTIPTTPNTGPPDRTFFADRPDRKAPGRGPTCVLVDVTVRGGGGSRDQLLGPFSLHDGGPLYRLGISL